MQYYVVTFTHTKIVGWTLYLPAHINYLKKLIKEDKLQISGPGVGTPVRSAQLVFKVTDQDELDRLVAGDPYSKHGLVATKTENLWNVTVGKMTKAETPDQNGTKYFRAAYALKQEIPVDVQEKHDTYLKELLKKKKIRAAGPYLNNPQAGLMILSVPEKSEAKRIADEDPFVKELGAEYQIIEWDPKFGEFK